MIKVCVCQVLKIGAQCGISIFQKYLETYWIIFVESRQVNDNVSAIGCDFGKCAWAQNGWKEGTQKSSKSGGHVLEVEWTRWT